MFNSVLYIGEILEEATLGLDLVNMTKDIFKTLVHRGFPIILAEEIVVNIAG